MSNEPRRTSYGEKGPDVKAWQEFLASKGYDVGTPDGIHGQKTEQASESYRLWVTAQVAGNSEHAPGPTVPFMQAKHFKSVSQRPIELVVLHSTENPIRNGSAKAVASYFAGAQAPMASAHYIVGPDETYLCVKEKDIAWAAPGANEQGIHIEMIGQAYKTNWSAEGTGPLDGLEVVKRTAKLTREICDRWSIPLERVDAAGLKEKRRGITTHAATTEAWKKSDHVDPGGMGDTRWPWDLFLELVRKG